MRIECPGCQVPTDLDRAEARAESFCPRCDYPLFWAVDEEHAVVERAGNGADQLDPTLRRRPGSAGRRAPGEPCRACGELNLRRAVFCIRCGTELHPPPPAPPEPEPAPAPPVPAPVVVAEPPRARWPLRPVAVALAGIIALSGVLFGLEVFASLLVLVVAGAATVAAVSFSQWR